jgi:hypothetical protein
MEDIVVMQDIPDIIPDIIPEKTYCGTNPILPDGYTRFATPYECLRKGVGVGKNLPRLPNVINPVDVRILPVDVINVPREEIGNVPREEIGNVPREEIRNVPREEIGNVPKNYINLYKVSFFIGYLVFFLILLITFQNTKPSFILNYDKTISNSKLYLYTFLISLSLPFIILFVYYLSILIK